METKRKLNWSTMESCCWWLKIKCFSFTVVQNFSFSCLINMGLVDIPTLNTGCKLKKKGHSEFTHTHAHTCMIYPKQQQSDLCGSYRRVQTSHQAWLTKHFDRKNWRRHEKEVVGRQGRARRKRMLPVTTASHLAEPSNLLTVPGTI